uniref:Uncharacterized protein n=1 Tax=Anguilla anguilla TaxID=7936 RepID=A0A0E9SLB4_ANGAN
MCNDNPYHSYHRPIGGSPGGHFMSILICYMFLLGRHFFLFTLSFQDKSLCHTALVIITVVILCIVISPFF